MVMDEETEITDGISFKYTWKKVKQHPVFWHYVYLDLNY